jgi:hypothetical protein
MSAPRRLSCLLGVERPPEEAVVAVVGCVGQKGDDDVKVLCLYVTEPSSLSSAKALG